jgi:DeoR family transcriptional regulator, aga operon transcriptional repressor
MSKSIANRHQYILNKLKEQGFVNVIELSEELNVSLVTIRKDLRILESRNLLHRTHGSATLGDSFAVERTINDKEKLRVEQKQRIARAASSYVEQNDSIIIGSGSTVLEFAKHIRSIKPLTVVTASLNVAQVLNLSPEIEVHQLGGVIRKSSNSAVGPNAEKMLMGFSCKKLFLGVDGIDVDFGLSTTNSMEASLNKLMVDAAQLVVVLADSTKFARRGFGKICDLSQIDVIITDNELPNSVIKQVESHGVEVVIA